MNGRQEASPKEGDERSVIELELLRDGRKRIRLRGAGKRKEDLLLHSDVPQQAAPKGSIDRKVEASPTTDAIRRASIPA